MPNPFCHVELNTTNLPKARRFYTKLFAWKLKDLPHEELGKYTMVRVGEGTGGGMMKQLIPGAGSAWVPYVFVRDIDASTRKAKKLGAKVMKDVTATMGLGWLSIIEDPTGAVLGLWEPKKK